MGIEFDRDRTATVLAIELVAAMFLQSGRRMHESGRIVELDALRALAAFGVLAAHLSFRFGFGSTGVELFFVVSGYLITTIVVQHAGARGFLATFYARRCLRIWPIYYLALAAAVAVNLTRHHPGPMGGMPYYLAYIQYTWEYWHEAKPPTALPLYHTWTLAAEEQFYLAWPALVMLAGARFLRPLALTFVILPFVVRAYWGATNTLLGHCDGLALGALLSTLGPARPAKPSPAKDLFFAAAWLLPLAGYLAYASHLAGRGFTSTSIARFNASISLISLSYFGLIGLVVRHAGSAPLRPLRHAVLVYVGRISYGLYLYHLLLFEWIDAKVKFQLGYPDGWRLDVLKVSVALAVAALSWHLIERPILGLKDRFRYQRGIATEPADESQASASPGCSVPEK